MTDPADAPRVVNPEHDLRGVLRIPAFRRLWIALSLSSFGDWLGLLALTALAAQLASGTYASANLAIAGVFILRLAPAIVIGPFAGVVADRLDRRWTMVVCDTARFALFVSIPLVGTLWWLLTATFLIEAASLVWIPSKEATVPNLVPRERLETANQLSLFTTYGSAPVAAAVFSGLALLTGILDNAVAALNEVDLALYFNALTFLVSALTILSLREIPKRVRPEHHEGEQSVWRTLVEGWRFVGQTPVVRGLVAGMLGAFAAGGAVVGLARTFVGDLGGGEPGYGLLFGTVFCGLAIGMFFGPRLVPDFSRRRLLGMSITAAGVSLALLALIPNMVIAVIITLVLGAWAGVAWVTGYTLIGLEVADDLRGRTFAFVQTMVRVVLVLVLAVSPLLAAAFGRHEIELTDAMVLNYNGAAITMLLAGLLAALLGVMSLRQMDDRRGVPLIADVVAAYRNEPVGLRRGKQGGFFVALEGGEGAGKSTQARLLAEWLRDKGHEVVVTFEPGATELGRKLRSALLDADQQRLASRTEALLFAADRAEHVATVVSPALERGAIVVTDRFVDSSIAYQGSGRDLAVPDVIRLSRWATDGLRPDLTVVLDLPPTDGLRRVKSPDKLEAEPLEFHERVRDRFVTLARRGGARYLLVDATKPPEEIAALIQARLEPLLPLSAVEQERLEAARREDEERRAAEEAERARREQAEAEERAAREKVEAEERAAREKAAAEERERLEQERRAADEERKAEEAERRRQRDEQRAREKAAAAEAKARRKAEAAARKADAAALKAAALEQERQAASAEPPQADPGTDPPTRRLSLTDELLGGTDDETVQLPQVRDDR
ncbi:MAG TPA: dTMP kinase [Actinomycetes bacterium]